MALTVSGPPTYGNGRKRKRSGPPHKPRKGSSGTRHDSPTIRVSSALGLPMEGEEREATQGWRLTPRRAALPAALAAAFLFLALGPDADTAAAAPCDEPIQNEIACENTKPGDPQSEWDVSGAGNPDIQGFATDISVDQGETVHFKIDTDATDYRLDIYRMGYYNGDGARQVDTVQPSAALPQNQPACDNDGRDRADRLRQLERVRLLEHAGGRRLGHLLREARPRGRGRRREATSSSSSATTTAARTCCSRRWTRRGRPTTSTAATASTSADPPAGPRLQGQLQPSVHLARSHARGLGVQRRVPDGALAGAQRLRRQLLHRGGQRPLRRRDPGAPGLPLGRPRRVLVRGPARQRGGGAGRRRQPRLLQRQRGVLEDTLGGQPPHWSRTTRRTRHLQGDPPARRSTRRRLGRGRGATRASARPRRRPARERAHRHDLHGQLRHHRDRGAGRRRQDALLARHERRHASRRARRRRCRQHARLRVGRGPGQRLRPAGLVRMSSTTAGRAVNGSSTTARTTAPARRPTT